MSKAEPDWLPTRQTLLSRLKDWDDADSWREFFETYWKLIYSVARRAGLGDAEAQEVVQETIITVSKQMPKFRYDPAKGTFKGWLRRTTEWRIQDQFRRRQRDQRLVATGPSEAAEEPDPALVEGEDTFADIWQQEWEEQLMAAALERVRRRVEPREYQVFDFCTIKGWPAAKVARQLGLYRPQVYYLNKKVTRLLQTEVRALQGEPPRS